MPPKWDAPAPILIAGRTLRDAATVRRVTGQDLTRLKATIARNSQRPLTGASSSPIVHPRAAATTPDSREEKTHSVRSNALDRLPIQTVSAKPGDKRARDGLECVRAADTTKRSGGATSSAKGLADHSAADASRSRAEVPVTAAAGVVTNENVVRRKHTGADGQYVRDDGVVSEWHDEDAVANRIVYPVDTSRRAVAFLLRE